MYQRRSRAYESMTGTIRILTLETFCTSHLLTLLSEIMVQHYYIWTLNIRCTIYLSKLDGNLYTPWDNADPKEDINFFYQTKYINLDTRSFHSEICVTTNTNFLDVHSVEPFPLSLVISFLGNQFNILHMSCYTYMSPFH